MSGVGAKLRGAWRLVRQGHLGRVGHGLQERLYSRSVSLGLSRDLTVPFSPPAPRVPFEVRPLRPDDDLSFLRTSEGLSAETIYERLYQARNIQANIPTCYVAVAADGRICYMQWLIPARERRRMQEVFGRNFPVLADDEALLEGAYTPDEFRGKGIMSGAMARIAEHGVALGARTVLTFVAEGNIGSLKGCKNAGFSPTLRRHTTFRLFRRSVSFERLPPGARYPFEQDAGGTRGAR
jgi:hypothetical protein